MAERRQDMWRAIISGTSKAGLAAHPMQLEGAIDLPRPMEPLDAADHALRLAVGLAEAYGVPPARITASIWGRSDKGSLDSRFLCGAVAEYRKDEGVYMRCCPWIDDNKYQEIKAPEGAVLHQFN